VNWYKLSSYAYLENLLDAIEQVTPSLIQGGAATAKIRSGLARQYPILQRLRNEPYTQETVNTLYETARLLKRSVEFAPENLPEYLQQTTGTGKSGWYQWEKEGKLTDKISFLPGENSEEPGWIKLEGLNFGTSKVAEQIQQMMGDWMAKEEIQIPGSIQSTHNVLIRGTKESWKLFSDSAFQWLENHEALILRGKGSQLPSEAQFNPNYQNIQQEEQQTEEKILQVFPLNFGENAEETIQVSKGSKPKPGIRLQLTNEDQNFYEIRDFIRISANIDDARIGIYTNGFDIFERDIKKWAPLSNKIKSLGYDTKPLNVLIEQMTGKTIGIGSQQRAVTQKAEELGSRTLKARMQRNTFGNIAENPQVTVGERFGIERPLGRDEFTEFVRQSYPAAFGENIPDSQKRAQMDGMFFSSSRNVSVLADQPGAGKTAQAIVAADLVRNEGQKILVTTPNILVQENWTGAEARGPTFFAGHDPSTIASCKNAQQVEAAITDPNIIWVIIPNSVWKNKNQRTDVATLISQASYRGVFSSMIMDEIQTIKNEASPSYKALQKAIVPYGVRQDGSEYGIRHRIGMTGTPSDNDPHDIYSQLKLLRHPVLYQDKGIIPETQSKKWILDFNSDGFIRQFLGGEAMVKAPTLSTTDRKMPIEQQEEMMVNAMFNRAKGVLAWAKGLNDTQKLGILDVFSSTFMRRNKEDIRPDIPEKNVNGHAIPRPNDMPEPTGLMNWHTKLLQEMANRKVPYTVQKANEYLQDPNQKVFIVTKHPDIAAKIVNGINKVYGNGMAAYVAGTTGEEDIRSKSQLNRERAIIPMTFKQDGGVMPGADVPLRAVVYTMELGAVGLNFDVATKAIFNDMDWNPSDNLQAEFRVHRITSQQPVNIDYFYFADSYDEEMYERVLRKGQVNEGISSVIRDANTATDQGQRIALAKNFIGYLVDSILFNIDLPAKYKEQILAEKEALFTEDVPLGVAAFISGNWYKRA
tara:strand:+ start:796 stop:3732 length:2937 start_codon:yes stop_codon:yes gene_type:complete